MKRPPSIEASPPQRRRLLSGEERELWEGVAKSVKPLRKRTRAPKIEFADGALPAETESETSPPQIVVRPALGKPALKKPVAPPPLAPIGRRERAQISKGRKEIDARLDLHGLTQARAHRALLGFLHRASADGMTFVLVITGKGTSGTGPERGVLRRQVPEWLALPEFRGLVVGFEEAHIGHGGAGALYVRVRRSR
jgi:DNA-nicking Smr family endonuclease